MPSLPSLIRSLRLLAAAGRVLARTVGPPAPPPPADPEIAGLLRQAEEARRKGQVEEAGRYYRLALGRRPHHPGGLRGLRDLAVAAGRWAEALPVAERTLAAAEPAERPADAACLAGVRYELGRAELAAGRPAAAVAHLKQALRHERDFVAAVLALGEAQEAAGDRREAVRTWERAVETRPALPLLRRLERVYREEGRPGRLIALYRSAADRAPDDPALAVALGRVYLELEMLGEAADQLEKVEVRAPEAPAVHALLGAVFERRGETAEAFEEYRRALRLSGAFEWVHRCGTCGASAPDWRERCPCCRRWNTLRPAGGG